MQAKPWFFFATARGDIVARCLDQAATSVTELSEVMKRDGGVVITSPMSPKADRVVKKSCSQCGQEDDISDDEYVLMAQGGKPTCDSCDNEELNVMVDNNRMRISYTSMQGTYDLNSVWIGASQVSYMALADEQSKLDTIHTEIYEPQEQTTIINIPGV